MKSGSIRRSIALLVGRPFFALALLLGRVLPASWLLALARCCSGAVYFFFPGVRRNLLANARHVLGETSGAKDRRVLAREMLASFSRFIVEWVAPKCLIAPESVFEDLDGKEHFQAAVEQGKGVIGITLHMGNYELPARELAALGHDVAIVFNRERVSFLERLRSKTRREKQLDEIVIEESSFFGIEVYQRLKRGGIVLLAGDQVGAPDAMPFSFLSGEATFSLWPARLAKSSGAPLLPAFCVRAEDSSYRLAIEPAILAGDRPPQEITEELVAVLAEYLGRYPGQWLMVHDFWGQAPARASSAPSRTRDDSA